VIVVLSGWLLCYNNHRQCCCGFLFSCVVNFRLEQVITPRLGFCLDVVVCAACLMDYYFYVEGAWLVGSV